ncbi:Glyoxalase/Bleomycin resistance protein/Dihydroxybiphenyl dioxygenase [Xylariaceae sp. FL0016]|nr:Glyoxalase/Bleomycin resistance protein/Dihydroxybiphenyl dioxygenase [Xylariaceae sp. FL0016]
MASNGSTSGKVISPTSLAHVVLQTSNYKAMVSFYKAFLGAHASYENENISFLTYDHEHHRIAIVAIPHLAEKDHRRVGMNHMAFTFDTLEDLVAGYQARKARDMHPVWSINHGPTTSIYYQDPDGNQIETQVDNFDSVEETTEYMLGADFAQNPIGADFDPEELIRRMKSGESHASIKKRPSVGPRGGDSVPIPPKPLVKESWEPIGAAA